MARSSKPSTFCHFRNGISVYFAAFKKVFFFWQTTVLGKGSTSYECCFYVILNDWHVMQDIFLPNSQDEEKAGKQKNCERFEIHQFWSNLKIYVWFVAVEVNYKSCILKLHAMVFLLSLSLSIFYSETRSVPSFLVILSFSLRFATSLAPPPPSTHSCCSVVYHSLISYHHIQITRTL